MNFKLRSRRQAQNAGEKDPRSIFNVASGEFQYYAEFFEKNHLEELSIDEKGTRVLFRKHRAPQTEPHIAAVPQTDKPAPLAVPGEGGQNTDAASGKVTKILSPFNGTFYSASSPESPPFAGVGTVVTPDTVLCLIEAMKIYNELLAETSGRIVKVLAQNAESVREGQELFWIE
ncbi:MAG: acetyl-CoA carboxylase biotin carboxyl carrier protein [Spirochaetota bacterium]|jgi:acetyl-CoA carboxylase biotin carboxyl carrier protein|nr:acetyl-CoA carboxylase biotin carboxyl carrier protein [Spirochaetota bacterium]